MIQKIDLWQSQHPYFSGFATILILSPQIAEIRKNQIFLSACLAVILTDAIDAAHICFRKVFDHKHFQRRTWESTYRGVQRHLCGKKQQKTPKNDFLATCKSIFVTVPTVHACES